MRTRYPGRRGIGALAGFLMGQALLIGHALAWGPGGHMVVAAIAYKQLPPAAQQQTLAILQAHPAMAKWKEQLAKDNPTDPGAYFFARASTWPDEIRRGDSPYDHPAWHYVDYPLTPPDFPFIEGRDPQDNILFGIADSEKVVRDPAATPEQRAAALSWLIHLVGDIHQPLHCAELVTAQYPLPEGDRGGNKFFVSVGGTPINLHAFWDRLPGQIFSPPFAAQSAERIERTYPTASLPELTKDKDPVSWSLEGRTIAIESAYLRGKLPGTADSKLLAPPLPPEYLNKGKVISDQRLALAGYRLAALLPPLFSASTATVAAVAPLQPQPSVQPAVSAPVPKPGPVVPAAAVSTGPARTIIVPPWVTVQPPPAAPVAKATP